jgi:hypothetical protein
MSLFEQLKQEIPELTDVDFHPIKGTIHLRNDSDGYGDYIAKWEYSKPLPEGMKVGKN